jgi:hypothetical protein
MDNNTTKPMTLKELVESGKTFTEIVEEVRNLEQIKVSDSERLCALAPITERDLESVLPKSRFAVYGTKEWEKARSIFKDDFDFSKEKEKSSFFLFEIVDGHYGRWGETLVVCEESKRRPGDKELSPECPLCSEETELQSSTTPCSQNKFRRI